MFQTLDGRLIEVTTMGELSLGRPKGGRSRLMCSSRKYPYPPPLQGGQRKFRGDGGGVQWEEISEEVLGGLSSLSPGTPSKIDRQAINYFTVNWGFKAKITLFIDDLLFVIGWVLFHGLHYCFNM